MQFEVNAAINLILWSILIKVMLENFQYLPYSFFRSLALSSGLYSLRKLLEPKRMYKLTSDECRFMKTFSGNNGSIGTKETERGGKKPRTMYTAEVSWTSKWIEKHHKTTLFALSFYRLKSCRHNTYSITLSLLIFSFFTFLPF